MLLTIAAFGKTPRENAVKTRFCYNLGLVFGLLKYLWILHCRFEI